MDYTEYMKIKRAERLKYYRNEMHEMTYGFAFDYVLCKKDKEDGSSYLLRNFDGTYMSFDHEQHAIDAAKRCKAEIVDLRKLICSYKPSLGFINKNIYQFSDFGEISEWPDSERERVQPAYLDNIYRQNEQGRRSVFLAHFGNEHCVFHEIDELADSYLMRDDPRIWANPLYLKYRR